MSLDSLDQSLKKEIDDLQAEGRAKRPERIITGYVPGDNRHGPRYLLDGGRKEFLRLNSNSYLSLSHHPALIAAAEEAGREFGAGPGAVRFIDGTYRHHRALEERIASFTGKPAAKIFNSAYTANCGLALTIGTGKTRWIGDQLNHNSIIRAMRIAGVPPENKGIYRHNDMDALELLLEQAGTDTQRVIVIFYGIFSMRGDHAPMERSRRLPQSTAPVSGTGSSLSLTTPTGSGPTAPPDAAPPNSAGPRRIYSSAPSARPSASTAASLRQARR